MTTPVTKEDLVELLNERTDTILRTVKEGFDGTATKEGLRAVEGRLENVEGRLTRVEATMVTKSYLDDKLADLKGDLILKMRKQDAKMNFLVEVLHGRKLLSNDDVQRMHSEFQIFPSIS